MIKLETVSYLLASLVLAWSAGWFFTHEYGFAMVLCCALWAALTVWLLVRSIQAIFHSGSVGSGNAEAGSDYL
jgi:hypothetical protein